MTAVWAHSDEASCAHPGRPPLIGWEAIQASWRAIFGAGGNPQVIITEERVGQEHDSGTFGVEFQTRGHFFKIVATNQQLLNPTQILGGSRASFALDELRLGFNITRLLPF